MYANTNSSETVGSSNRRASFDSASVRAFFYFGMVNIVVLYLDMHMKKKINKKIY